jgi:hypothetical protein
MTKDQMQLNLWFKARGNPTAAKGGGVALLTCTGRNRTEGVCNGDSGLKSKGKKTFNYLIPVL